MRLIDADKLKDIISDTWVLDRIDEQPTVDTVPVVRCKDCKYTTIDNDVIRRNCGLHLVVNLNDDDFCSRGERIEDDTERSN